MADKSYLEKLALSLMVKHDEPPEMVERCIRSVEKYVDGIFLTITKNSPKDNTKPLEKLAQKYNARVSYFDWVHDFSKARNFAFEQIPNDEFGWILWLDVDDIVRGASNIPQILQEAILNRWAAVFFTYWYSVDLDDIGNIREIVIEHKRERIIRNDDTFKWIGRLHETLIEQKRENVEKFFKPEVIVVHLTDDTRMDQNLERNIKILEEAAREEDHKDPRTVMYLAKAYFDKGKMTKEGERKVWFELARALLFEYLEGAGKPGTKEYREPSGWDEERSSAWSYLAEIFRMEGKLNSAIKSSFNALEEAPQFPNYYLDLAMTYTLKQDWEKAEKWLAVATSLPVPQTTLILNPRDMKTRALEIDYHIAFAKQDLERALKSAEELAKVLPDRPEIQERLEFVKGLKASNRAAQSLAYLTQYLDHIGEPDKIASLLRATPKVLEQEAFISQARSRYLPPKMWDSNEIAIVCGKGFEKWSPKNVKQGIGGSEEAVIYLSRELTKLGYKVTVFGDPQDDAGNYDGVTYKMWHELNPRDTFNILILWRAIGFADNNFAARQVYLWLHDVPQNPDFTEERVNKIDKIFVLSEYHKSLLRLYKDGKFEPMPEDKVFVTSNGIIA